jgi:hypothetical protein
VWQAAMVLAVPGAAVAPSADGFGAHSQSLEQHDLGLGRAGNLLTERPSAERHEDHVPVPCNRRLSTSAARVGRQPS